MSEEEKEKYLERKITPDKKILRKIISLSIILILLIVSGFFIAESKGTFNYTCGDGTPYQTCSKDKPFFCDETGTLIKKASMCGCPEIMEYYEGECFTDHQTGEKNITLEYYLDGKKGKINLIVYEGVEKYISEISRIYEFGDLDPSRKEVKLEIINNEIQGIYLKELVKEIQNKGDNKLEQARIAISLVQRIPYETSNKSIYFVGVKIPYTRYPYEVLYHEKGICGEKSELLTFILREIGFGTVIFYFPGDNHEAVGIKCPISESYDNTGYCFIETTAPSIISSKQNNYLGEVHLNSWPDILFISEGESLPLGIEEYQDSKTWIRLRKIEENKGELNFFRYFRKKTLEKKYGINDFY